MKSLFGRIQFDDQKINREFVEASLEKLDGGKQLQKDSIDDSGFSISQLNFENAAATIFRRDSFCVLSDCRIDNRLELIEKLCLSEENACDEELILEAFLRWKEECVQYFLGDFVFVLFNELTKEVFCARDHFGIKPFYYCLSDSCFVFSSELAPVLKQKDLPFQIDEHYLSDLITVMKSGQEVSCFQEIKKLPPASYLQIKQKRLSIQRYWTLQKQDTCSLPEEEQIQVFRDLLIESVKCRTSDGKAIGAELSGGIDSSTVCAIANTLGTVKTFSHCLAEEFKGKIHPKNDERLFIQQLIDFCKIEATFFIDSAQVGLYEALQNNIEEFEFAAQQNFSAFSDQLYSKVKEERCTVLLSGFGGDEAVSAKAPLYLVEMAKNGLWKAVFTDLRMQRLTTFHFVFKVLKLIVFSKLPGFIRIYRKLTFRKHWKYNKYKYLVVNEHFAIKTRLRKRYFAFLEENPFPDLQTKSIEKLSNTHVSQRFELSDLSARKYGIEYRYPLFDKRLIEFYLSLPTHLKARQGIARYAIRKAVHGLVPASVQWRDDKSGTTIPSVYSRFLMDKEKFEQLLIRFKDHQGLSTYICYNSLMNWFSDFQQNDRLKLNNPASFYCHMKLLMLLEKFPHYFENA